MRCAVNLRSRSGILGCHEKEVKQGGEAMARSAADFVERNTERAAQATNYGFDWLRDVTEHHLHQSKVAADTLLTLTRRAGDVLGEQASTMRERSMEVAEASISNTFDCLQKLARVKDPQELVQAHSEFVSRQAQ